MIALGVLFAGASCAAMALYARGCMQLPPIIFAEIDHRRLSPENLTTLSAWLDARSSGWSPVVVTAPAPAFVVELHHPASEKTTLAVYRSPPVPPGWNNVVWLKHYTDGKLVTSLIRHIPDGEVRQLAELVGP